MRNESEKERAPVSTPTVTNFPVLDAVFNTPADNGDDVVNARLVGDLLRVMRVSRTVVHTISIP